MQHVPGKRLDVRWLTISATVEAIAADHGKTVAGTFGDRQMTVRKGREPGDEWVTRAPAGAENRQMAPIWVGDPCLTGEGHRAA